MTTETKLTEAEWNKEIDEWHKQQLKDVGLITIPELGLQLSEDPSYAGVTNQTHTLASQDLIRYYAYAIGDPNPLWQDPTYARNSQYGTIVAPPTFEAFIAPTYTSRNFNPPYMGRLMSGVDHRYFRIIRAGDEFRVFDRTHECVEKTKAGKPYRLFLLRSERKYINQKGETTCVAYGGAIALGFPPGKEQAAENQAYAGIKKRRFTKEELERLNLLYEEEIEGKGRRGADILYWEDVIEGEELKELAAGPLDIVDACCFNGGIYANAAFALKWHEARKRKLQMRSTGPGLTDPDTGAPMYGNPHINEAAARAIEHIDGAIAFGAHTEGILAKLACNWMGDSGFVKRLDCQMRHPWIFGHIIWLKGKVVKKYTENDEPLVDLELVAENQDGLVVMPCAATVRLESREYRPELSEPY